MSISILKLKNKLITSLQEDMTDDEVMDFQEKLTNELNKTQCGAIIIDISALEILDSFMARVISETARMAGFLGAKVVVCGMKPNVAISLEEMGGHLSEVHTALSLDDAIDIV